MSKDMSNIDIVQYEGGDYAKIMDNYNLHEITAAIANRAGKAAETIEEVKREVERLENNPDVVDIVATYADLQAYDTSGLTNKDVIRVIADETQDGLSSYYRWNSPNPGWNFVGVIPGGDGVKELSSADYNYPASNPDRVALWLLDNGLYTAPAGVTVAASTTSYPWYNTSDKTILVGGSDTVKGIYTFLNGKTDVVTTQVSDGTEADEYTLFKSNQVLQTTGQSTTDTMSQKAITDAIAGAAGITELTSADYNYPTTGTADRIVLAALEPGMYVINTGVNYASLANYTSTASFGTEIFFVSEKRTSGSKDYKTIVQTYRSNGTKVIVSEVDYPTGEPFSLNGDIDSRQVLDTGSVVQTTGTSTTDVMSQNAVTGMVFKDPGTRRQVRIGNAGPSQVMIGYYNSLPTSDSTNCIVIGGGSQASVGSVGGIAIDGGVGSNSIGGIAIGGGSYASGWGAVALGYGSFATGGTVSINTSNTNMGYNNSQYRLLTGLYDPQSDHDAANKQYVDTAVASAAANTISSQDWSDLWQ